MKYFDNGSLNLKGKLEISKVWYEYGNCRSGFNHFGYCTLNGVTYTSKCHYINRTWEAYPGDTAKKDAIYNAVMGVYGDIKAEYLEMTGGCRVPKGFKKDVVGQIVAELGGSVYGYDITWMIKYIK